MVSTFSGSKYLLVGFYGPRFEFYVWGAGATAIFLDPNNELETPPYSNSHITIPNIRKEMGSQGALCQPEEIINHYSGIISLIVRYIVLC
jgi:hypothetical protein